jgi:hypothetical protein
MCGFVGFGCVYNGSPTREINIQRWLKQGDTLGPFLFLLLAGGFGGVMSKAKDLELFKGLRSVIVTLFSTLFNTNLPPCTILFNIHLLLQSIANLN